MKIGKYEITGELGTGGFGKVYKAFDPSVGRVVAIKVLNVEDDPTLIKRFRAEATTSARLQHKNIVTVHEFGEDRGKQFLVMEFLDGRNLYAIIRENAPIPLLQKLQIMSEVSQGLHYAHQHDVVHRDVKPANIMWLADGSVKVMDFGIARLMHHNATRLTRAGSMIGTMQYMAPEQFTSDSTDARCDIWAFGVVMHEFLTGINPFDGPNAMQVMFLVTRGDHDSLLTLPERPAGLAPLVRRLLAKSPDDRYPTMEDAQFDLEQVIVELKRTEVGTLEQDAGRMIQAGRLNEALTVVRQILDLDQSHEAARRWRKDLTDRIKLQSIQARIAELVGQAESKLAVRDYGAAADHLEAALQVDPNHTAVRARLAEVRAEQDRIRRAMALVAEARLELQHQALTSAFEHASQAAEADPNNSETAAFLEQVRGLVIRRESETRRKGALSKAKGLILVQNYAGAAQVLEDWVDQNPADPEVLERLAEAHRLQAEHETQLRVEAAVVEAREMVRKGFFRRAIEILLTLDPPSPEVVGLLTYAREQLEAGNATARQQEQERQTVLRLVGDCRGLLLAGNLDHASQRSTELSTRYPNDPSVIELRDEVARRIQEWREKRRRTAESLIEQGRVTALRETMGEIEGLIARGLFLPAIASANSALERFPNEPKILALRQQAQQGLDQQPPGTRPGTGEMHAPPLPPVDGGDGYEPPAETGRDWRTIVLIIAAVLLVAAAAAFFLFRGSTTTTQETNLPGVTSAPVKEGTSPAVTRPAAKSKDKPVKK